METEHGILHIKVQLFIFIKLTYMILIRLISCNSFVYFLYLYGDIHNTSKINNRATCKIITLGVMHDDFVHVLHVLMKLFVIFQLLPECSPNSVAYILELLTLRHCAGCNFYRAEGRGQSWDTRGNHIKDVRLQVLFHSLLFNFF